MLSLRFLFASFAALRELGTRLIARLNLLLMLHHGLCVLLRMGHTCVFGTVQRKGVEEGRRGGKVYGGHTPVQALTNTPWLSQRAAGAFWGGELGRLRLWHVVGVHSSLGPSEVAD